MPHGGEPLFRAAQPSDGRWQIDVEGVADLSTQDALERVGRTPPRPRQSERPAFQEVGERLCREGYRGVLAPSASRPSHVVLCLFREAEEIAGAEPMRPPMTYRRAPAPHGIDDLTQFARVADWGRAPRSTASASSQAAADSCPNA